MDLLVTSDFFWILFLIFEICLFFFFWFWETEILRFIFNIKVNLMILSIGVQWILEFGQKEWRVEYRYGSDPEGEYRTVTLPSLKDNF